MLSLVMILSLIKSPYDDEVKTGAPYVEGAKVVTEVVEHGKDRKIHIIKFKGKKNYRRNGSQTAVYCPKS